MTLTEAEAWLASLINVEQMPDRSRARFSLDPIRRLLEALGDPQESLAIFHIAGSKGKGSTALFAEALLRGAGASTGTFTSPHLSSWVERFRIDGENVEGQVLADAVDRLRPIVERLREEPDAPSFFDVTTAAGLLLFAEAGVEAVMLEVGLGGRLDSTNVVLPRVTCITSIELEHTEKLGVVLGAVAAEKAGIAKPGVPMLLAPLTRQAASAVEARCAAVGAPLLRLGVELPFHAELDESGGARVALEDGTVVLDAVLGTPGLHQAANAALAFAGASRLGVVAPEALAANAAEVLSRVRLPARAEILSRDPLIVVDGAHTPASATALAAVLSGLGAEPGPLVLSISIGKGLAEICETLVPFASHCIVTRADPYRSVPEDELQAAVSSCRPELPVEVVSDPTEAVRRGRSLCGAGQALVVTGSVYLAGIARSALGGAE